MCQQYISVYPEVVEKPEIVKTAAIFWWCYKPSLAVIQLRAIPAEDLKIWVVNHWKMVFKMKNASSIATMVFPRQRHHVKTWKIKTHTNNWHHQVISNTMKARLPPALQTPESMQEKHKWLEIAAKYKSQAWAILSTEHQKAAYSAAMNYSLFWMAAPLLGT